MANIKTNLKGQMQVGMISLMNGELICSAHKSLTDNRDVIMRTTFPATKSFFVLSLLFCISCRTSLYAKLHNDLMILSEDEYLCEIITEEAPIVSSSLLNYVAKPTDRNKFALFLNKILGEECVSFVIDKELRNVSRKEFYKHLAKLGDVKQPFRIKGYFIEGLQIYNAVFNENHMVIDEIYRSYLSAVVKQKNKLNKSAFMLIDIMPRSIKYDKSQLKNSFTILALLERKPHNWKYLAILANTESQKITAEVFGKLGHLAVKGQLSNPKK